MKRLGLGLLAGVVTVLSSQGFAAAPICSNVFEKAKSGPSPRRSAEAKPRSARPSKPAPVAADFQLSPKLAEGVALSRPVIVTIVANSDAREPLDRLRDRYRPDAPDNVADLLKDWRLSVRSEGGKMTFRGQATLLQALFVSQFDGIESIQIEEFAGRVQNFSKINFEGPAADGRAEFSTMPPGSASLPSNGLDQPTRVHLIEYHGSRDGILAETDLAKLSDGAKLFLQSVSGETVEKPVRAATQPIRERSVLASLGSAPSLKDSIPKVRLCVFRSLKSIGKFSRKVFLKKSIRISMSIKTTGQIVIKVGGSRFADGDEAVIDVIAFDSRRQAYGIKTVVGGKVQSQYELDVDRQTKTAVFYKIDLKTGSKEPVADFGR